jgi:hypothetical protein
MNGIEPVRLETVPDERQQQQQQRTKKDEDDEVQKEESEEEVGSGNRPHSSPCLSLQGPSAGQLQAPSSTSAKWTCMMASIARADDQIEERAETAGCLDENEDTVEYSMFCVLRVKCCNQIGMRPPKRTDITCESPIFW